MRWFCTVREEKLHERSCIGVDPWRRAEWFSPNTMTFHPPLSPFQTQVIPPFGLEPICKATPEATPASGRASAFPGLGVPPHSSCTSSLVLHSAVGAWLYLIKLVLPSLPLSLSVCSLVCITDPQESLWQKLEWTNLPSSSLHPLACGVTCHLLQQRGGPRNCFSPFPDIGGSTQNSFNLYTMETDFQSSLPVSVSYKIACNSGGKPTWASLMLCYYTASHEFRGWKWDLVMPTYVILWTLILTVNWYFPLKHTALILSASENCWPM